MKKLNLLSLFGLLAAAFTARADINNTNIYIVNNTKNDITVSQPYKLELANDNVTSKSPVAKAMTVQPGKRKKIASLGRDQNLYWQKYINQRETVSSIDFTTDNNRHHRFQSEYKINIINHPLNVFIPSKLTYNGAEKFPHKEDGFEVMTKGKLGLYKDIEMVFKP